MNPSKRGRATRLALAALGAVGVLAICAGVAEASFVGTAKIDPGTLSVTNQPASITFPETTLNGTVQYITPAAGASSFDVVDATGSGDGWTLNVNATVFDDGTDTLSGSLAVSGSGTQLTDAAPSLTCPSSSCNVLGSSSITSGFPITVGTTDTPIADQPIGDGMGTVHVSNWYWWFTIPLTAKPGTYTSTIVLDASSGPSS